ncbi:MAG: hypothetical protein AAB131_02930 [Actinomycetota bacterium]
MPRRRLDPKLLLASLGIAAGLVLVIAGAQASVTGREQQRLPDEIESIDPIRGATQAPRQTRVFVDLIIGYQAVLVVDGVELPTVSLDAVNDVAASTLPPLDGDQDEPLPPGAVFEPGNVTLTFVPRPGNVIEQFDTGPHTATVIFWRTEETRVQARAFSWDFYVV